MKLLPRSPSFRGRKPALCGLPDCDCGYTISTLEGVLEDIKRRASPRSQDFLHPTKQFADDVVAMADAGIGSVLAEGGVAGKKS